MSKDLWELAKQQHKEDDSDLSNDRTMLVFGSSSSGKSSLVNRLVERDDAVKPTIALEYKYIRRAAGPQQGNTILGNVWELGGGTWLTKLMDFPICAENIQSLCLVLFVDLSKPSEMWFTTEKLLYQAGVRLKQVLNEIEPKVEADLKKQTWQRLGEDHPDRPKITPFLVPTAIIGGKYDLFQEFDTRQKETITKTLRYVAHTTGASLHFFSSKQETLGKACKSILTSMLFGTAASAMTQLDPSKPLAVPAGLDLLAEIGSPPYEERGNAAKPMAERWKAAFTGVFPQEHISDPSTAADPSRDAEFAERAVDELRRERDEQLERYRKAAERRVRDLQANIDLDMDNVVY